MTADYPIDEVPATPEYVLEVFRDSSRAQVCPPQPGEPYPTFDTPIREWLDSWVLERPSTEQIRDGVNVLCRADITPDEWSRFEPEWATVGELCRLVAIRGQRPAFRPWRSIVGECLPAGVFLTVRSLLVKDGADPADIAPSAPLAPYHSKLVRLGFDLARLAPGRQPRFVWDHPAWLNTTGCVWCIVGFVSCLAGAILFAFGLRKTAYALALAAIARLIGLHIMLRLTRIPRVEPEQIRTFRDLAYCLAGQVPRRPIQPTA
jgi:hypothetical protein